MAIIETVRFDKTEEVVFDKMDVWGFIRARVSLAKPGIMIYRTKDGREIRELVPREVLQDKAVIHSIAGTPVTIDHPKERIVTPKTAKEYMVGSAMHGEYDESKDHQVADICLTHESASAAIEAGKNMFSPCYPVKIDDTGGTDPEFGQYDTKQVQRGPYNHNALTDNPRGGVDMTIHNDDAGVQTGIFIRTDEGDNDPPASTQNDMGPKLDAIMTKLDSFDNRLKALEGKGNGGGTSEPPKPPIKADSKTFTEQYNERQSLLGAFKKLGLKAEENHTNEQLKRTLVTSQFKSIKADSADEVVDAMWQELSERIAQAETPEQPPADPKKSSNAQFGVNLLNTDSSVATERKSTRISASELKSK
jgi:hypothetical protein